MSSSPQESAPLCYNCHRSEPSVVVRAMGSLHICLDCLAPLCEVTGCSPDVVLEWFKPGDPEKEKEANRRIEEEVRSLAVDGDADGVNLTLDGYGEISRLEIAPWFLRSDDFAEKLVCRLNEAIAKARPLATWQGYVAQGVAFSSHDPIDSFKAYYCGDDAAWNWFPFDFGDPELVAGLWYFWRQKPMTVYDLASAARLDPEQLADVARGSYPLADDMLNYELEWIRQDLAAALGEALGVSPERLLRQGVAICWPLDVANYAIMLGEIDPEKKLRTTKVRYDEASVRALWQFRETFGGAGPLETASNAIEAGALRIEIPERVAYPHTPLKSRWDIAYMSYPDPTVVVYAELLLDELELSLHELHRLTREARMKEHGGAASGTDLTALVHNRTDNHGAYAAYLGMRQVAMDLLGIDPADEEGSVWAVDKGHRAREEQAEALLLPEVLETYGRYFLEESPRIKLTSSTGRTWADVEKDLEAQAWKKLRLRTPLTG